ncbi:transposase [Autumnicola musiva]|uniref:Transposase n=1 Tax=Autumnicola musiva TaxID=3075589 RepID=A0ABU3DBC8_9FLAO|nr:transposase [Zunongwangia sp. F117]MDT0678839.1 transposase [Zunongwangia sp. F117]
MMKENRKTYSKEFKQKAVELSSVRGNVSEIAGELGIRAELLYRWRRGFTQDPSLSFSGNGNKQLSPEAKELARLKRELADVTMERDILKKSVDIFSANDRKFTNS